MKVFRWAAQTLAICALATMAMAQTSGRYPVKLILLKELHSGGTPQGTIVPFMVDQNVTDETGKVLVAAGTPAYGEVVWSRREGALSAPILDRPARLAIKLTQTYDPTNNPLALTFGTADNTFEFNRDNTSLGQTDAQVAEAWKDPEKRALFDRLVQNYTGTSTEQLTPQQQAALVQEARRLSLTHAADLAQGGKLSALGSFVRQLRDAQSPQAVFGSAPVGVDPLAIVAAVQEMNQLTRTSKTYVEGRFTGRNILAPAGLILDAYVLKNP